MAAMGPTRIDFVHAWVACDFMIQTMNRTVNYQFILRLLLFLQLSVVLKCLLFITRIFSIFNEVVITRSKFLHQLLNFVCRCSFCEGCCCCAANARIYGWPPAPRGLRGCTEQKRIYGGLQVYSSTNKFLWFCRIFKTCSALCSTFWNKNKTKLVGHILFRKQRHEAHIYYRHSTVRHKCIFIFYGTSA